MNNHNTNNSLIVILIFFYFCAGSRLVLDENTVTLILKKKCNRIEYHNSFLFKLCIGWTDPPVSLENISSSIWKRKSKFVVVKHWCLIIQAKSSCKSFVIEKKLPPSNPSNCPKANKTIEVLIKDLIKVCSVTMDLKRFTPCVKKLRCILLTGQPKPNLCIQRWLLAIELTFHKCTTVAYEIKWEWNIFSLAKVKWYTSVLNFKVFFF